MKAAVVISTPATVPSDFSALLRAVAAITGEYVFIGPQTLSYPPDVPVRSVDSLHELELLKQALLWARDQPVLLLSAGLTSPSSELARYLDFVRAGFDAVIPMVDAATIQPLFAVYAPTCKVPVSAAISVGKLTISDILDGLKVRYVDPREAAKFGDLSSMLGPVRHLR